MKRPGSATDPYWYKDAIIYQVHVRTFFDSNSDGIGDFPGLTEKLDHIQRLGASAIWLLPFYPSPLRDDGYDIAHYEGVHPQYGSLRDFRIFLREAHARNLQVITELVINHTSDQHPWFLAARRAPAESRKRDYYVWSDTPDKYSGVRIIFSDTEHSNWAWDQDAHAYYWHRFFSHQPDLNFDNPHVVRTVLKVMKFWLDMGVDGLRLDAVPYLVEREGTICENLPETHAILKRVRQELDARYENRMLLAEANQWPADVRPYFGDGDESHMAFHFPLMPRLFMAVRQEDRYPIVDVLTQTPDIPESCQWATFLRNHDELTLEMVTSAERDYMWQQYAADPQMRLNMGIRRRLAPLMENNRQRIELLNSLLFSLPGTPVVYYGDEIGMGDNVYLGDRNGVRTPMQWTGDRNAGFSRADPARLFAPPVMDPVYGYQGLNVEAQEWSPFSLLNWMRRIIAIRQQHKTFGRGSLEFLDPTNPRILAFVRRYGNETILVVANLARSAQPVELDLQRFAGLVPLEMLDRTEFPRVAQSPYVLALGPYAFYWFLLVDVGTLQALPRVAPRLLEAESRLSPALLAGPVWEQIFEGHLRTLLERDHLPSFLARQRWFTAMACGPGAIALEDWIVVKRGPEPSFLAIVGVSCVDGTHARYVVPLATVAGDAVQTGRVDASHVVARITGAREGILYEGLPDDLAGALVSLIAAGQPIAGKSGTIAIDPTPFLEVSRAAVPTSVAGRITRPPDAHNALAIIGERFVLKLLRRLEPGYQGEIAIPLHVTGPRRLGRVPRIAAGLTYHASEHEPATLGVLQEFLPFQRNAWDHGVDEVARFLDRVIARGAPGPIEPPDLTPGPGGPAIPSAGRSWAALADEPLPTLALDTIGGFLETASTLGKRTAELHQALAAPDEAGVFGLDTSDHEHFPRLATAVRGRESVVLMLLKERHASLPPPAAEPAWILVANEEALAARITWLGETAQPSVVTMRVHGDLHLGQVLLHQQDALFIDFEGDPLRPREWRQSRQSPMRDVASMVQSFAYAAYAGLLSYTASRPGDRVRLSPWMDFWRLWSSAVFLRSYRSILQDGPLLSASSEAFDAALDLLLIDQALLDLEMEVRYRPEWAQAPLTTLTRIVAGD
jgi:maltose alpha-D-glucosyltransferase / alpha-amylase